MASLMLDTWVTKTVPRVDASSLLASTGGAAPKAKTSGWGKFARERRACHLLPSKPPNAPVGRDDAMTRRPRCERVVPQRVPHGTRRAGQMIRESEISGVRAHRHLAQREP